MKTNKQNFSTPITCWNCDTTYDYQQYKDCPICDNHFTAAPNREGRRVPVVIDYIRGIITTLLCLLFLCGCTSTKPYCPTYANNTVIAPVDKRKLTKWDTVPATYADVAQFMAQDTIPYKPSMVEKIGAGIATYLIFTMIKE